MERKFQFAQKSVEVDGAILRAVGGSEAAWNRAQRESQGVWGNLRRWRARDSARDRAVHLGYAAPRRLSSESLITKRARSFATPEARPASSTERSTSPKSL